MAVSYVFIGPCNFIPLAPSVALTIAASAISSFGSAAVVVSSFGRLHSALLNLGLKDDTGTYLKVSGKNFLTEISHVFLIALLSF